MFGSAVAVTGVCFFVIMSDAADVEEHSCSYASCIETAEHAAAQLSSTEDLPHALKIFQIGIESLLQADALIQRAEAQIADSTLANNTQAASTGEFQECLRRSSELARLISDCNDIDKAVEMHSEAQSWLARADMLLEKANGEIRRMSATTNAT